MISSNPQVGHNSLFATVVTTSEQMHHVFAIRGICFMEENGMAASQTFDGNDFQCTHVLLYCDNEPIAACRIRWFRHFAKIERTALRKSYRNGPALKVLGNYVFGHIARKGYDTVTTTASPIISRLWRTLFGFKIVEGKSPLSFKEHKELYYDLIKKLDIPENSIDITMPSNVLMRTEGDWDQPSSFE